MKRHWKVAVLANIKDESQPEPEDVPPGAFVDFDHIETVNAIRAAIETDGHETCFIQADSNLPYALRDEKPDICFNLSEGLGGDAREAQTPALLEMLRIPYTASRVLANGISLDKTLTKRIWRDKRLPVSPFDEFITGDEPLRSDLKFPLFVKPACSGTGLGVDLHAIANNEKELRERAKFIIHSYGQPALVETFLPGREFTVGVLGSADAKLYSRHPEWYGDDGFHYFPILELDMTHAAGPWVYGIEAKSKAVWANGYLGYFCPANVEPKLARKLKSLALRAHQYIHALDISRTDIRLDEKGIPRVMEINTIPGITPDHSDLCLQANAEGMPYNDLILEIVYLAAERWGLLEARGG